MGNYKQLAKTMELVQSFCVGCSAFQQNQGMAFKPQGALKLLLFRLPKDIQKANDKMVFFSLSYSLSLCCSLSGRYCL